MLIPLLALVSAPVLPTFEELELNKIKTYNSLKNFHEELTVTSVQNGKTYQFARSTWIDGARSHSYLDMGTGKVESVCDGKTDWIIVPSQGSYYETKLNPPSKFDPKAWLLKADADGFNFTMSTEEPVKFACHLPFNVVSLDTVKEGGQALRKVVLSVTNSEGTKLTITQWFLPDRWLLKRFDVNTGPDGPINMKGEMTTLDLHASAPADEFKLDPKKVEHLQKKAIPPTGT
jgi:hypothetical protein